MPITVFYAAILALFYLYISLRIISVRKEVRVAIGDGGSEKLIRAIRAQANFSEYVPLTLLLLYFLEMQNANSIIVHLFCAFLLVARIVHAYGVSQINENFKFRFFGMLTTVIIISSSAIYLLLIGVGIA